MPITYEDSAENTHSLQTEAGSGGTTRPVHGVPTEVTDALEGIQTNTENLDTKLDAIDGHVDGVEAALTTITGHIDGVETSLTTIIGHVDGVETALTTLAGYVDGLEGFVDGLEGFVDNLEGYVDGIEGYVDNLEGYLDTVETKLDSIITNTGIPSGGPKFGQVGSIGTAADIQFGTQALSKGFYVTNISSSGQTLYISQNSTVSSSTSFWLFPGQTSPFIEGSNVTVIYMRASATGGAAVYSGC